MNIKRIIAAALALMSLTLAACSNDGAGDTATDKSTGKSTEATATEAVKDERTFSDLHAVADKVKGFYGENVEFIFTEDEYSDEVLMFTYGLYEDKFVNAVDSYVLTECDGMVADTFAIVNFKEGTDKALIDEAAQVIETEYIEGLKSKLAAYNPEEFAASDGYNLNVYSDAVVMIISSDNADDILAALGK